MLLGVGVVAALHAFHHIFHLASNAVDELVVSHLHAVPTLVAVHGVEAADDAGDVRAVGGTMLVEEFDEALAALRVGVAAVHEAVYEGALGNAVFLSDFHEFEQVVER